MRFKLASLTGGFRRTNGGDSAATQGSSDNGGVSASVPIAPLKSSSKNPNPGKKEKGENVTVAVRFRPLR
jgi:hypothetical protein